MPRLASGSPFSCVSTLRLDKPTKTLGPSPVAWAICTITLGWGSLGLWQTPVLSCPFLAGAQVQCQSAREWRAPPSTPHGPRRMHGGGAEALRWQFRPCHGFCWPFHSVGKCPRVSVKLSVFPTFSFPVHWLEAKSPTGWWRHEMGAPESPSGPLSGLYLTYTHISLLQSH